MREQIEKRRAELQAEHARGQQVLVEMQQQVTELEKTLLRIGGAIQLCDEFLTQPPAQPAATEPEVNHGSDQ